MATEKENEEKTLLGKASDVITTATWKKVTLII